MTTTHTDSRVSSPTERSGERTEMVLPSRKEPRDPTELKWIRRRRVAVALGVFVVIIAVAAGLVSFPGRSVPVDQSLVLVTVRPRDFPIVVTERGTIESQNNVTVICEVDDIPDDGIWGTPILWIIENGSEVEEGQLVVEFDKAPHVERLDEQYLETTYARGQFIARTLDYENRLTTNETEEANAELAVQTAKLQLQQFEDEQGGTFQMELQGIELDIQQSDALQQINERNLVGMTRLHELGYKSKGDLAQARLKALYAKSALSRENARRRELVLYNYARSRLQLEGALASAERAQIQVERNNKAALAQQEVWLKMAEQGKVWHEARLDRYEEQLGKCDIYAPQSGMVAYHVEADRWGGGSEIAEGVAVRYRQPILSIPDLTRMQVQTAVHESVIDKVDVGMSATVRLDAYPERSYAATVESLDVLPDPGGWLSSDTKIYKTVVTIDQEVSGIKPGMTAVVEIHIEQLTDVLSVPIQAIVRRGDETWCYVSKNGRAVKNAIKIGKTNDKLVEIRSGLAESDLVVVNPSAILADDPDQKREIAPDRANSDEFPIN